jgi:hypothetical protein
VRVSRVRVIGLDLGSAGFGRGLEDRRDRLDHHHAPTVPCRVAELERRYRNPFVREAALCSTPEQLTVMVDSQVISGV